MTKIEKKSILDMTQARKLIVNSYQVNDRVYAGEYAGDLVAPIPKIEALVNFGITHFIDLTEEGELAPYQHLIPKHCSHFRFPIHDVSVPSDCESVYELMLYIDKLLSDPDNKLYIHCWGGSDEQG